MEEKLLIEINRFREIAKLPLLSEGPGGWLDNLIKNNVRRITVLDDIIKKLGYQDLTSLTDDQIDVFVDELSKSGLDATMVAEIKAMFKNVENLNLTKSLLNINDNFVNKLKIATKGKSVVKGLKTVTKMTTGQLDAISKSIATKFVNDAENLYAKQIAVIDDTVSDFLQQIYDLGVVLHNVDEIYDIFDAEINKSLTKKLKSGKNIDAKFAEDILQESKLAYRKSSKTKDLLDKFKEESRVSGSSKGTKEVSKFDKTVAPDFTPNSWVSIDPITKMPIKHVPPVVDDVADVVDDVVDDGSAEFDGIRRSEDTETSENIFERYGNPNEINKPLLAALQRLIVVINTTTSENLMKVMEAIKRGKRIKWKNDLQEKTVLKELKDSLSDSDYEIILGRLNNPKPVVGILNSFFWTTVEPLIRKLREIYKQTDFFRYVIYGKSPKTIGEYFDEFKSALESKIITQKDNLSEGDMKSLKDKFLRLSTQVTVGKIGYDKLWEHLKTYVTQGLDSNSLYIWQSIESQLMKEGTGAGSTNWRWVAWKKIVNDPNIEKAAEREVAADSTSSSWTDWAEKSVLESGWFKRQIARLYLTGPNIKSFFITGHWRTPKEMQEYLIRQKYARRATLWGNKIILNTAGVEFIRQELYRFVVVPVLYAGIDTLWQVLRDGYTDTDYTQMGYDDFFIEASLKQLALMNDNDIITLILQSNEFKKNLPEWYSTLQPL